MDDIQFRMLELSQKGYYCSQILIALFLEAQGKQDPDLVRAMAGLALGAGSSSGTCGALEGGACAIALYVGKGQDSEEQTEQLWLMLAELWEWFENDVGASLRRREVWRHPPRWGAAETALWPDSRADLLEGASDTPRTRDRPDRAPRMAEFLRATESLCPVCLEAVPARLLAEGHDVVLEGNCRVHAGWQTLIWSGPPSFESWCGDEPFPAARQTCTAVIEVTRRCDLACPLCFAESSPNAAGVDPPVAEIAERLVDLFAAEGAVNIQFSGGEPTTRDDLPQIVEAACAAGFTFVQLNTNGIRLASEMGYAEALRRAGLASVFLQFDGVTDDTYRALRGRPLAALKIRAIERCARAGLAVVLVPTMVVGINDGEIGSLVRLAASWPGVVRGLHFQPVSYFGRYPRNGRSRLTLPEMLRALEKQTAGEVRAADFAASCCEHPRCSFRARYWVRDEGRLEPVRAAPCRCSPSPEEAAPRAVAATSRQWSRRPAEPGHADETGTRDGLSRFLDEADRILAVSGMLFQDAWSVDMERIGRCCVQVVTEGSRLVPFCLWNLTSESGRRLYPRC